MAYPEYSDHEVPVLIRGVNFRAVVRVPYGDWRMWEITGVYVDDSERDIYDLILDAKMWNDSLDDQVGEFMFSQEWRVCV